jgi:hypothetical protein
MVYFGSENAIPSNSYGIRKEHLMAETAEAPVEEPEVAPMWELAECTCPDWCERDHEQD